MLILLVVAAVIAWSRRQTVVLRPPAAQPPQPVLQGLRGELERLQAAGDWDELLRRLDRTLPEWTTSSSLIEVARATAALDRELAATPDSVVSDVVTTRLAEQVAEVSSDLWLLAERLDQAARRGSSAMRRELEQEDEVLLRLLPAIREARAEIAGMRLEAGSSGSLDRAEGRFRALAATARELRELEENATVR
jgi:hypothetical protein